MVVNDILEKREEVELPGDCQRRRELRREGKFLNTVYELPQGYLSRPEVGTIKVAVDPIVWSRY